MISKEKLQDLIYKNIIQLIDEKPLISLLAKFLATCALTVLSDKSYIGNRYLFQ